MKHQIKTNTHLIGVLVGKMKIVPVIQVVLEVLNATHMEISYPHQHP